MGKILTVNDLKSYSGLNVGSTNTALCPTKSQIEGFVKSGYAATFNSGVANNQLVDSVTVSVTAKYVKGVILINRCYNTKGLKLYVQDLGANYYTSLNYGQNTGILTGSNNWNVASTQEHLYAGWLDEWELEGDFFISVWGNRVSSVTNKMSNADTYTAFIGSGEGTGMTCMANENGNWVNIIGEYVNNKLNGDGSNYYIFIEVGEFA